MSFIGLRARRQTLLNCLVQRDIGCHDMALITRYDHTTGIAIRLYFENTVATTL